MAVSLDKNLSENIYIYYCLNIIVYNFVQIVHQTT